MKRHTFYQGNNVYILTVDKDLFGCTGVHIYKNNSYVGMVDTPDETDFLRIEKRILTDKDYVYSSELMA
ncbi:hypothetical protein [Staphylococcus haemolyticus]|uniref:hypothetical protein n=1 Tax=Staphylococcus haemolyticus TaxID=1283 RepID=UPI0015D85620|nr:hypothetical protein [Staphylococcus haemolyticus]